MNKLVIKNLSKTYPNGVKALNNVSIEIENGMFGLLGPNGAGKSSLMRTLATLQEADSGSAHLNDIDILNHPEELRKVLGYLPQEFGVYPRITAEQLLDHMAILKGITNSKERKQLVDYLLDKVNLYEKRKKNVKSFSGGMKQRVGIAQALIGNPKLIIVDEPTAGLDPSERNRFYNLLAEVGKEVIVILSTHIVDDVRELCTKMAVMNLGQIVYQGTPQNALDELDGNVFQKMISREELEGHAEQYAIISNKMVGGQPLIHVLSETNPGNGFEQVYPSLEDVFFFKNKHIKRNSLAPIIMFKNFFLLELKYALKKPMVYIFLGLFMLLTFAITSSGIVFFDSIGNAYVNSPHSITVYTIFLTLFGLMIAVSFYNDAALRDHENKFNEILFSAPISKPGYFFGRFFGALVLATIPILGVFLGVIAGTILAPAFGWVDPERFGDFYLATFINNYFLIILPNMFFAGTIIFALATKWKSTVISFVGSLVIIIGYIISGALLSDIDSEAIAALTDTFGIRAYELSAKYYTSIEKNTLSPSFSGLLLLNRLIWMITGMVILAISYYSFSFRAKNTKSKSHKDEEKKSKRAFSLPALNPVHSLKADWVHFKSFFIVNFLNIVKSPAFKILFLFSAIILMVNLLGGAESYGLQSYPVTYKVMDTIRLATGIFVIIVLVFFSGELIWRDRESKINEVIDATPHTSFISLSAKALSLVSIAVLLHLFFILCGIGFQLAKGFNRIELDVYLIDFFFTSLAAYIVWSGVMTMIQVLSKNKYIGYFVSILVVFLWGKMLMVFDVQSNMLSIGSTPKIRYSDMNGFGPFLEGVTWFNLYWVLFSFVCVLIAGALWNRGAVSSLKERVQIARKQIPKNYRLLIVGTVFCWVGVAGYVFYNTQILNKYKTSGETEQLAANYEKEYKKYEQSELPKINDIKYSIEIFPYKRDVLVNAAMTLVNESESIIDSIHYTIDQRWEPEINIPNSELVLDDQELEYRIYKLAKPIYPGDSIQVEINTKYITEGFENAVEYTRIVNNGTFLNNGRFLPSLGYQVANELEDKNKRKKYGLKPKERMPELESNCSKNCMRNYMTDGSSDFINIETIISTSSDQIAIAPGSLLKKWKENGRNYFHYKVDHPSMHFYSFVSGKYKVKTRKWNGINLEVYYDKKHPQNVDMMMDAMERSLVYYTENFGPYMHNQCRIIEFPRYSNFAQAFPGTMPYSEALGFITNLEDEEGNNIVDAIISHEMSHQWWGHQIAGADVQGSTMLSESFAEYSSLMTMKSIVKTPMKMREFLKYNHDRYLTGRSNDPGKELPLYKVENQMHIHYGKGSIILYALQDYIGEDKVNTALRSFLEEFKYRKPPYPTSLDFMKHLDPQVPDSLKYLINDWFKEITLYDNRLENASYQKQENGKYLISMDIECNKIKADHDGNETPVKLDDWVDIGAFADPEEERLLIVKRVKINKAEMTFNFEIDSIPAKLAIDPYHLLIDRVYKDNIKKAKEVVPNKN